jgi:hypothetical protein
MTLGLRERPPDAVRASPTAWPDPAALRRTLAAAVVIGAFLSFVAAFDSRAMALLPRTLFMIAVSVIASLLGFASFVLIRRSPWAAASWWRQGIAAALLITAPVAAVVWLGLQLMLGVRPPVRSLADGLPGSLVTSLFFCLWAARRLACRMQPAAAEASPAPPRFLERLPPKLRDAELWAVEAEDHYLRLHTSRGQDLILMRFSDALAELEGADGAQTHRSWWVARAAVVDVRRADGRATLTLRNGAQAPVSRSHGHGLRSRGWI